MTNYKRCFILETNASYKFEIRVINVTNRTIPIEIKGKFSGSSRERFAVEAKPNEWETKVKFLFRGETFKGNEINSTTTEK